MKNYKKILAMILGTVMTVSMLAGCGSDSSQTPGACGNSKGNRSGCGGKHRADSRGGGRNTERRGKYRIQRHAEIVWPRTFHNSWGGRKHGYRYRYFQARL